MINKIDIIGNSGCNIKLIDNNYILKSTDDKQYIQRLILQANKQQQLYNKLNYDSYIQVPKIYNIIQEDTYASILMEYIESMNFIQFFNTHEYNDIDIFINHILNYINDNIQTSSIQKINISVFLNKINDIRQKCISNQLDINYNIFDQYIDYINLFIKNDIQILIGECHGDLTLSNIRFLDNKIYFIDFLDSFIESPINDIVKLRQDTKYYWSLFFYNDKNKYDIKRIINSLNYIDNKIIQYNYYNKDIILSNYTLFELMNLFRLLPYSKTEEITNFIINAIIQKFNIININKMSNYYF